MELQEFYGAIKATGAEVFAISVDTKQDAQELAAGLHLEYPVLYDTTTIVTRTWGVFDLLNDGVAAPAAYVFNASGELVAYRIGENIADRPHATEILGALATG